MPEGTKTLTMQRIPSELEELVIPALRILLNREDLYQTVIKYYKKYQIPADASGIKCEMNYPSESRFICVTRQSIR